MNEGLFYYFVKSYPKEDTEKREEWFKIIKKYRSLLPESFSSFYTGVKGFEDLPKEVIWEMMIFLEPEDLKRLFFLKRIYYEIIFENDNFWRIKFINDFVIKEKIYGEDGYGYPKFIERLFNPKNWKERYFYFYRKLNEFIDLNNRIIYESFTKGILDLGFITFKIIQLPKIFQKKIYDVGIDWDEKLDDDDITGEGLCKKYGINIKFEDKLFVVNIINHLDKEIKNLKKEINDNHYSSNFITEEKRFLCYISCCFDDRLKNSKDIFWSLIKMYFYTFKFSGENVKKDKDIVWYVVKKGGYYLIKDIESYANDRELVLEAIKSDKKLDFKIISKTLRYDKEVLLAAIEKGKKVLKYTSTYLQNDREVVLAAVNKNGLSLEYASTTLKDDEEIVSTAFVEYPPSLEYASERLHKKLGKEFEGYI